MRSLVLEISIPDAVVDAVTLEDSTATFGIKRDQDAAVIVPAGTATVNTDDQYSYTTGLLDTAYAYTAVFKVLYTPTGGSQLTEYITVAIPASYSIRSLAYLRRALARRLGGFEMHTQTITSPANNKVQSSEIIGSSGKASEYDNTWVYMAVGNYAGSQKLVEGSGYDSEAGTVEVVSPWGADPPAAYSVWEVHTVLPAKEANRTLGLREVINQALQVMWTIKRETFTGDGTEMFLVGEARDWLTHESQIVDIYSPASDTETYRPYSVGNGYKFFYNAERPRLEGAALDADEEGWEMAAIRPAYTWIKHGGAWGESVSGLQDDTDETLLPPQAVLPVAMYFAYLALANQPHDSPKERNHWEAKAREWAPIAARIMEDWLPQPDRNPQAGHSSTPRWGMKGLLGW